MFAGFGNESVWKRTEESKYALFDSLEHVRWLQCIGFCKGTDDACVWIFYFLFSKLYINTVLHASYFFQFLIVKNYYFNQKGLEYREQRQTVSSTTSCKFCIMDLYLVSVLSGKIIALDCEFWVVFFFFFFEVSIGQWVKVCVFLFVYCILFKSGTYY